MIFSSGLLTEGETAIYFPEGIKRLAMAAKPELNPFTLGTGILPCQGMRQIDFDKTGLQVFIEEQANPQEAIPEEGNKSSWQGDDSVLVTLAGTDRDLLEAKIENLDAKVYCFHDPETAAIEELGHELRDSQHKRKDAGHRLPGEHFGDVDFPGDADGIDLLVQRDFEESSIQKYQGIHGLILRGRGNIAFTGEMGKEGFDLFSLLKGVETISCLAR